MRSGHPFFASDCGGDDVGQACAADDAAVFGQYEDVTRGDLAGIRPPRYLGGPPPACLKRDLKSHAEEGLLNYDQMKRLTRVSMGACQVWGCRGAGVAADAIYGGLPGAPLPLSLLATMEDTEEMAETCPVWFCIPNQWIPYHAIGTVEEETMLATQIHL